jgi:hypothetical protein
MNYKLNSEAKENIMEYTEIVKTETITKKSVQTAINAQGPFCSCFSVDTRGEENPWIVDLVIGADYEYRCVSGFDKDALGRLIDLLVDIKDAMRDCK